MSIVRPDSLPATLARTRRHFEDLEAIARAHHGGFSGLTATELREVNAAALDDIATHLRRLRRDAS